MADYGLLVHNSNGNVQIDSTYRNLGVRTKGSIIAGGTPSSTGWYRAAVTLPYNAPVLAWRCNVTAQQAFAVISGGNVTYYFDCQGAGAQVDYWLFDYPDLGALAGNYGLRVWNAAGEVVFDSRAKYMRIVDAVIQQAGVAAGDPITDGIARSYPSVGRIAVVQSLLRYRTPATAISPGPPPVVMQTFVSGGVTFGGANSVTFSEVIPATATYTSPQPVPAYQEQLNYSYLVLDVANY